MDYIILALIILIVVVTGLYFLNKFTSRKMGEQQSFIESNKQFATIFVIDKKRDKITNVNMPKMVTEKMPWYSKLMKMYFVQAKVGPQIVTFMCDKHAFSGIQAKKNIKVQLSGIYIVSVVGMKTKEELNQIKKDKKKSKKDK